MLPGKSERQEKEVDTDGTRLMGSDFLLTLIPLQICSFVAEMFAPPYNSKEKLTTDGRTPTPSTRIYDRVTDEQYSCKHLQPNDFTA